MTVSNDNPPSTGRTRGPVIKRHGMFTRVWHWINLVCLVVLLMSGLQIFNAHPALYWGSTATFDAPALQITARRDGDGRPMGLLRIGGHEIETTGLLGLSHHDGDLDVRAFPAWMTLPGPQWLAMGRYWHFAAAWVFGPLLFAYLVYSLVSARRRRRIWPTPAQWRGLPRTIAHHVRFKFDRRADYNGLQKIAYLLVLFGLLPLMVATGLTMSPTIDAAWPWLLDLFGGRQSARTVHFIGAVSLLAFFIIHLVLVLVSGVLNNLRSMITGGYAIDDAQTENTDGNHG